jgi:transcription elongation factor Elf1
LIKPEACDKIQTKQRRLICPVCNRQTLLFLRPATEAKELPLWCKRCNREVIVNIAPEPEP